LRQLMQSRAVCSLCYALVMALVATLLPTPLVKPACAQLMPTYSVGVADFANESGVQGDLLARLATDAVVVEMSKTNRYDVSITRTMMKQKMDELGLRPPLTKTGLVRLGESLEADAMLQGAIKSVGIAGSGPTRRASVTLVVQMIDQASGEIINGTVQTGNSSARVGYTADDSSLITEAVNNAAFLAVRTMIDYVIPEATVMMNIGASQVMLNKGSRDGIKPGMRMIILRDREIIGYVDVTSADPTDAYAKVVKTMRGIQPEDKARAIFEMPTVSSSLKSEPLPTGAPSHSRMGGSAGSKIGKFLVGLLIVFGIAAIFTGGSGSPDAPKAGVGGNSPLTIRWDPKLYNHGQNVSELQVIRDQDAGSAGAIPVRTIRDNGQWNAGFTDLSNLYGTGPFTVTYYQMPLGSTTPTSATQPYTDEGYGVTHQYQLRALLRTQSGVDADGAPIYGYEFTKFGNYIVATAVQPVATSSIVSPLNGESLYVSQLLTGDANLTWLPSVGSDQYRVAVRPVQPGTGPTWTSNVIYYGSGTEISLPAIDRLSLANVLSSPLFVDREMYWRVDTRHGGDTSPDWVQGNQVVFRIGSTPGGPP
jgi:hypothetical protein